MDLEQVKNMEIMMDGIKMGKQGEGDASTIPNAKAASESLAGVQSICQRRTSCSTRSCCFGAVGRWGGGEILCFGVQVRMLYVPRLHHGNETRVRHTSASAL